MNTNFYFNTAVFIDAGVDNYQQLFDGVVAEAQPFLLDTARDGIEQIDGILQQYPQVKTVHIISHGSPGCLYLGNSQFTLGTLEHYATELQRWNIDNLLLYGCNVAAGDPGAEFVAKLRGLTGADIAASATLTGAAIKGGNWELEVRTGEMSSSLGLELEVMGSYPGVLNGDFTDSGQSLDNSTNGCDISLADVDGDGDLDAFVANVSEPNKVWKNDGNGNFTDSGQSLGSFNSMGVSLADVYGDGDVDAFVANVSEPNKVWKNDGSGNFTDSGQSFEDGEDSIKLEGVSFTDLAIEPWGSSTLIKYGEETLATVYRVNADLIGADDFV